VFKNMIVYRSAPHWQGELTRVEEALAKATALSGYTPNVEAIAAYEPDLVVHDGSTDLGAQLDSLGIANWVGAAAMTFDDIYVQIEQLGAATGHVDEAAALVADMRAAIEAAVASVPGRLLTSLPGWPPAEQPSGRQRGVELDARSQKLFGRTIR
jgi:ABC-type Fe3+-hydroxamate transport system substrate-binding protein